MCAWQVTSTPGRGCVCARGTPAPRAKRRRGHGLATSPPHTPCPFTRPLAPSPPAAPWRSLHVAGTVLDCTWRAPCTPLSCLGLGLAPRKTYWGFSNCVGSWQQPRARPPPPRPTTPPPPPPPLVSVSNRPTHHGGHVPAACKDGPDRGGGCLCVEGGKSSYLCPLFVGGQQLPSTPPHPPPPCPQPHPAGPRATGVALPVVPQRPLKVRSGVGWRPWDLVCCCVCPVPPRSRCGVEGNGRPSPAPERPSAASHHAHCLEVVAAGTGDPPPPPPPPSWPRTSGL